MERAWVGTHPRWLGRSLQWTVVLNGADAAFTLLFVGLGLATEANPLMADLLERSPLAFVLVKIVLVSLSVGLLWRLREHRTASTAAAVAVLAYFAVIAQHLRILGHLVGAA